MSKFRKKDIQSTTNEILIICSSSSVDLPQLKYFDTGEDLITQSMELFLNENQFKHSLYFLLLFY